MKKKAQIHLTETIAVIFIFFVLVLFGLIFFFKFQTGQIEEKKTELVNTRVIDTATKTLFLPEFSCSKSGGETTVNCLDMMKVDRMIGDTGLFKQNELKYFELFSFANITVKQIYPPLPLEQSFKYLYGKKPPQFRKKKPSFFSVSLKDERLGKDFHGFGYLLIEVYS